jgi:alkylhydroperoxidase family enzyme
VIGSAQPIGGDLKARLKARFNDTAIVNLVAYGSTMLATNAFNTALGIPLDDYLKPYGTETEG